MPFFCQTVLTSLTYTVKQREREKAKKARKKENERRVVHTDGEREKERLVELTDHRTLGAGPSCPLRMVGWGVGDVNP